MFDEQVAPGEKVAHLEAIEIWRHRSAELIASECNDLLPQTAIHSNDAIVEKLGYDLKRARVVNEPESMLAVDEQIRRVSIHVELPSCRQVHAPELVHQLLSVCGSKEPIAHLRILPLDIHLPEDRVGANSIFFEKDLAGLVDPDVEWSRHSLRFRCEGNG